MTPPRVSLGPVVAGSERFCVPAAVSALTGYSVDIVAEHIWRARLNRIAQYNVAYYRRTIGKSTVHMLAQKALDEGIDETSKVRLPHVGGVHGVETEMALRSLGLSYICLNYHELTGLLDEMMPVGDNRNRAPTVQALGERLAGIRKWERENWKIARLVRDGLESDVEISSRDLHRFPMLVSTSTHMIAMQGFEWADNAHKEPQTIRGSKYRKCAIHTLHLLVPPV